MREDVRVNWRLCANSDGLVIRVGIACVGIDDCDCLDARAQVERDLGERAGQAAHKPYRSLSARYRALRLVARSLQTIGPSHSCSK